jgi:hypothetical protein
MRRTKIAAMGTAGLIALGGVALFVPAGADAATGTSSSDLAAGRLTRIKDALKGLVSDGTLTQAQADKVASTLAERGPGNGMGPDGMGPGRGMRGGFAGPDEIAKVLGMSVDDLQAKLQAGKTLAQIAAEKKIDKATLIDKLVAACTSSLAAAVKDGRLTQAQADEFAADAKTRITAMVDQAGPGRMGQGMGGMRRGMGGMNESDDDTGGMGGMGRGGRRGGGDASPSPSATTDTSSFATT